MIPNYLTRIPRLYRFLAPVYVPLRPLWTGSLNREAEKYLEQVALPPALHPAAVVLDLGCGPGSNLTRMLRLGLPFSRYVGFDLSPAMLTARRAHVPIEASFVQGDAQHLPFANESFDLILSTWMFSHMPEPVRVVDEAQRLLRPSGRLVVASITRPSGLGGALLRPVESVFLMGCIPPDEIRAWPGVVEIKTFLGGFNVVASLRKTG